MRSDLGITLRQASSSLLLAAMLLSALAPVGHLFHRHRYCQQHRAVEELSEAQQPQASVLNVGGASAIAERLPEVHGHVCALGLATSPSPLPGTLSVGLLLQRVILVEGRDFHLHPHESIELLALAPKASPPHAS